VLFNCNDAKFFGLPLRQILRDYPKIDFILRSHSSASPVPLCIEDHERLFAHGDRSHDSADQFASCALHTGARYAIPFASNHCFLHPETRRFNATVTTPELARRRYAALAADAGVDTECVVMPPGSSWSDTEGFDIAHFDFSRRDAYVEALLAKNSATLAAQQELESRVTADFEAFQDYFGKLFTSLPRFIKRGRLPPIVFRVADSTGMHLWLVNARQETVSVVQSLPPDLVVLDVHAIVLNDCAKLRMFSVWTASKRLKIHLPTAASLAHINLLFTLLDMYETDLLPLARNFTARSVAVRLRRWREPAELGKILLRRIVLRQRFSVGRIYPVKSGGQPDPGHT
jgi:UDP-MurNAc hydroxylase